MPSSASFNVKEKVGNVSKLAVSCSPTNSCKILQLFLLSQLLYVGQCVRMYESAFVLTHKTKMRINLWMSEITGAVERGVVLFRCYFPWLPSSTLPSFLPQSFFQFASNLSSFSPSLSLPLFLLTKVFTCFVQQPDCIWHCLAATCWRACGRLHGNPVQGSVILRMLFGER